MRMAPHLLDVRLWLNLVHLEFFHCFIVSMPAMSIFAPLICAFSNIYLTMPTFVTSFPFFGLEEKWRNFLSKFNVLLDGTFLSLSVPMTSRWPSVPIGPYCLDRVLWGFSIAVLFMRSSDETAEVTLMKAPNGSVNRALYCLGIFFFPTVF